MLTGLIAIGLILCQIQTVFALETKSLQLISNSTNESLSNTTVTVLDVESSNSYYLNTDDEGYVIDDNQVLSTLDNKVLVYLKLELMMTNVVVMSANVLARKMKNLLLLLLLLLNLLIRLTIRKFLKKNSTKSMRNSRKCISTILEICCLIIAISWMR